MPESKRKKSKAELPKAIEANNAIANERIYKS